MSYLRNKSLNEDTIHFYPKSTETVPMSTNLQDLSLIELMDHFNAENLIPQSPQKSMSDQAINAGIPGVIRFIRILSGPSSSESKEEPKRIEHTTERYTPNETVYLEGLVHQEVLHRSFTLCRKTITDTALKEKNLVNPIHLGDLVKYQYRIPSTDTTPFCTFGILFDNTPTKTSKKGHRYATWKLSDLKGSQLNILLFGDICESIKAPPRGAALYINTPKIVTSKSTFESRPIALSVTKDSQVIFIAMSSELAFCDAKVGKQKLCNAPLNKVMSSKCVKHMQKEFRNTSSKRMDLNNGGLHRKFKKESKASETSSLKRGRLLALKKSKSKAEATETAQTALLTLSKRKLPLKAMASEAFPPYLKKFSKLDHSCSIDEKMVEFDDSDTDSIN